MKKCRARYGLNQQDMWCRPCRRKKKCIQVQSFIEDENQIGDWNRPSNSSSNSNDTLPGHSTQMILQQGMRYSPRSASSTQQIPTGLGSNKSAGSYSVYSYPSPFQLPGPSG